MARKKKEKGPVESDVLENLTDDESGEAAAKESNVDDSATKKRKKSSESELVYIRGYGARLESLRETVLDKAVSEGYIDAGQRFRLMKKTAMPNADSLAAICVCGGLSANWLLLGKGPDLMPTSVPLVSEPWFTAPEEAQAQYVEDILSINQTILAQGGQFAALRCTSNTLADYKKGDILFFDLTANEAQDGGIYFCEMEGETFIRHVAIQGDTLFLKTDNPPLNQEIPAAHRDKLSFKGKLVGFFRTV